MVKLLLDFYKESQDAAKERLKLPIIPFYIILVILSYWRPISLYIFSKSSIEDKIEQINKLYADWNVWDHLWNLFLLIIFSFLSSIIFPLIMWGIEYILRSPNIERKKLLNTSKNLDMIYDLESTQHKFDKEKILSGKKEVEEYNESIEALKKSYDERIRNAEIMNQQKEKNFESELDSVKKSNSEMLRKLEKSQNENLRMQQHNISYINSDINRVNYIIDYAHLFDILNRFINATSEIIFSQQYLQNISAESKKLLLALIRGKKGNLLQRISTLLKNNENLIRISLSKENHLIDRKFIVENNIGILNEKHENFEFYNISDTKNVINEIEFKLGQLVNNPQISEYMYGHNLKNKPGNPGE